MVAQRVWNLLGCLLLVGSTAGAAFGQQYQADPVDKTARAYSASAKQWLTNPAMFASDKEHFDAYFDKFYFPDMTHFEDADLAKLGDARYNLFKKFLWATNNAQLQQDLTTKAFDWAKKVIPNQAYHPAVRYNAVLIFGMLDEQYGQPSKPLPQANAVLTKVVENATSDKPRFPPPITLGAIIGLERHAQLRASLPPESVAAMTAALTKLVMQEKPNQEVDPDAYAWIRLRAAETLAKLGAVGEKNNVHNALVKYISTSKSLDDRCEAAGLLDKFTYKDVKLDDATADALFALARDVATAEDKRAADFQSQYSGGAVGIGAGPMRRGMGEMTPGGFNGEQQQETYPRRQVLARLTNLRAGLTKVSPSLPEGSQKKAAEVLKAIEPARLAAATKETIELKLAGAVRTMATAINKAVPPAAVEKAVPAKASAAL